jgi:hypothetical protein
VKIRFVRVVTVFLLSPRCFFCSLYHSRRPRTLFFFFSFSVIMPIMRFGKIVWEGLSVSNDINLSASFAGREACTVAELQHQYGFPIPPSSSTPAETQAQPVGRSRFDSWASVLRELSRSKDEDAHFLSAAKRYDLSTSVEVGGFLALIRVLDSTGQWAPPVLLAIGPIATQFQGAKPVTVEDFDYN